MLDPDNVLIAHRLYRQHTLVTEEGIYLKDLARLGRELSKTIIVDNIADNFERQEENGIEIITWMGDPMDRELESLSVFLRGLVDAQVKDVRPLIKMYKHNTKQQQIISTVKMAGGVRMFQAPPSS